MPADPKSRQCRHLFTDGRQCASHSLRNENFCYYHHTTRVPAPRPTRENRAASAEFILPMPENRAAIQHAIGEVLRRVALQQISDKAAGLLFYGLSIASANLPRPTQADIVAIPDNAEPVREIVIDPVDGLLAPSSEPLQEGQRLITPGRLRHEERLAEDRAASEYMERVSNTPPVRRPPVPPNSPELERILRLYPPPPHMAIERHYTPAPQDEPPPPPKPWQSASPTPIPELPLEARA